MPMIQNEAELKMNEFLQYLPSTLKLGGYAILRKILFYANCTKAGKKVTNHEMTFTQDHSTNIS
jgi:hypothetical protein